MARLPLPCRDHTLSILGRLAITHGIDDLYWSTWREGNEAEGSKDGGMRSLKWEEVVKAVTSLPAKVANAVGRWSSEGWKGFSPDELLPK
jgi:telomere length regulation protein